MVWLLRHTETDLNRLGVKHGHLDVPLNPTGIRHAAQLALPPALVVYTSPLIRAVETARIVAMRMGVPDPIVVPALIERSFGAGEGLTRESLTEMFPAGVPGMESYAEAGERARQVIDLLPMDSLVVTHAGVIKGLTGMEHVANGETVEIRRHPQHAG